VAVDDSVTVGEDAGATALTVLANDTDADGDLRLIGSKTNGAHGQVSITAGGAGLTYRPDDNYCNSSPPAALDSFTYSITPGGSTATVTVTVTCVDDVPGGVDDSAVVAEDAPSSSLDVLANDVDIDGGPRSISAASDPANGTVVIAAGGTGLAYQPDANYCNNPGGAPDTFTYTLNGGSQATVSVVVDCVDDPAALLTRIVPRVTSSRRGKITINTGSVATCPSLAASPCTLTGAATINLPGARRVLRKVTLGSLRATIAPGASQPVKLKLSSQKSKLFRELGRIRVTLSIQVAVANGADAEAVATKRLRAPAPRR
jgi:VCBS repeat-containing protein